MLHSNLENLINIRDLEGKVNSLEMSGNNEAINKRENESNAGLPVIHILIIALPFILWIKPQFSFSYRAIAPILQDGGTLCERRCSSK
jgi:hypothetical protein